MFIAKIDCKIEQVIKLSFITFLYAIVYILFFFTSSILSFGVNI